MSTSNSQTDEEAVAEAYRNYCRAQISLWTKKVRAAKDCLSQWQAKLHAASTTDQDAQERNHAAG